MKVEERKAVRREFAIKQALTPPKKLKGQKNSDLENI